MLLKVVVDGTHSLQQCSCRPIVHTQNSCRQIVCVEVQRKMIKKLCYAFYMGFLSYKM